MHEDQPDQSPHTRKVTITTRPFAGFSTESAKGGEQLRVLYKCIVTADDPRFYLFVNQIDRDFLVKAGIKGDSVTGFFVMQRPDGTADIYTHYPAIVRAQVTRDVLAGEPLFESDIKISTIDYYHPAELALQPDDVVICVIKVGWKYALFFDASREIGGGERLAATWPPLPLAVH